MLLVLSPFGVSLFVIFSTHQVCAYTPQEGKITGTFGPIVNKAVYPGSESFPRTPYMGGFGVIALGDVSDHGSLEISTLYLRKMYVVELRNLVAAEETDVLHMNMGYRRWWNPYFSGSLTFFSAYTMGVATEVQNDFTAAGVGTPASSARDKTEYGLDFSLTGELWGNRQYAVVLDARYSLAWTKQKDEYGDHLMLMLGIRYLIQSEKRVESRRD